MQAHEQRISPLGQSPATTELSLRERAIAAREKEVARAIAAIERDNRRAGAILADLLESCLGLTIQQAPTVPTYRHEGIEFTAVRDNDSAFGRDSPRSWRLLAAVILWSDADDVRVSERVWITSLADLGELLAEYEEGER